MHCLLLLPARLSLSFPGSSGQLPSVVLHRAVTNPVRQQTLHSFSFKWAIFAKHHFHSSGFHGRCHLEQIQGIRRSKRDGAKMGTLCPGMQEGGWAPAPLGALTGPESSGAAKKLSPELVTAHTCKCKKLYGDNSAQEDLLDYGLRQLFREDGLVEGPGAQAQIHGELQNTQSCWLEAAHGEEQFVTAANGKAGECDQKPGLLFTVAQETPVKACMGSARCTKTQILDTHCPAARSRQATAMLFNFRLTPKSSQMQWQDHVELTKHTQDKLIQLVFTWSKTPYLTKQEQDISMFRDCISLSWRKSTMESREGRGQELLTAEQFQLEEKISVTTANVPIGGVSHNEAQAF
ncbi:hypothetical protein DV515_00000446 [Chloebia gouldiae]|uniref:Uncharacterized protein n=1 Tax=Chloebia gouldiae TaxID=44316 RepID=A0A3L8SZZ2_CHLGU|nr:hypothetical protein DV515_00000446 [Chloebia gouldiae]